MSALFLHATDLPYFSSSKDIKDFNKLVEKIFLKALEQDSESGKKLGWFFSEEYKKIKSLIFSPSAKEIKDNISNEEVCFIDWKYPSLDDREILVLKELPIISGLLTNQEEKFQVTIQESLQNKLNLEVVETTKNYSNLAGAETQMDIVEDLFESYKKGRISKVTLFLLGIAGAGKTFLAECIAGEKKRHLVKLDLSKLIEMENSIQKLHFLFSWIELLHRQGIHLVLLLDEVAQALRGGMYKQNQFKGQLLTIIEDLNTSRGYQIGDTMIIATDNNIREIMIDTPQFMARWEESFFLHFPKKEDAMPILRMYLKEFEARYEQDNYEITDEQLTHIYDLIDEHYRSEIVDFDLEKERFIYSAREIRKFASRFATMVDKYFRESKEYEISEKVVINCANRVRPQQKMLKMGVSKMINDAEGMIVI